MHTASYNSNKLWIAILLFVGLNVICEISLSTAEEIVDKDKTSVREKIEYLMKRGSNIGRKRTKSEKLKNSIYIWELEIFTILSNADVPTEVMRVDDILEFIEDEGERTQLLRGWRIRNGVAVTLLQHWREHPEDLSDEPTRLHPEKARKTTDRQLHAILSENEEMLRENSEIPLVKTNLLECFFIDRIEFSKDEKVRDK